MLYVIMYLKRGDFVANIENLKPIKKGELSKEEAKKRGSIGGINSGKAKAEKRLLKDTIEMLLNNKPTPEMINECAEKFGFNPKDLQEVITGGLISRAMSGDPRAYEVLRDTAGQKPVDRVENTNINKTPFEIKLIG